MLEALAPGAVGHFGEGKQGNMPLQYQVSSVPSNKSMEKSSIVIRDERWTSELASITPMRIELLAE